MVSCQALPLADIEEGVFDQYSAQAHFATADLLVDLHSSVNSSCSEHGQCRYFAADDAAVS